MPRDYLTGYADRLSVAPGETVRFMASSNCVRRAEACIVRTICGDLNPEGPGFKEIEVETDASGAYAIEEQACRSGSHVVVPASPLLDLRSFSLQAVIWPTTPGRGRQGLLGRWSGAKGKGFALLLDEAGALALVIGNGESVTVSTETPIPSRSWTFVGASYDAATETVTLYQEPLAPAVGIGPVRRVGKAPPPSASDAPFLLAGLLERREGETLIVGHHYNGKMERPRIANRALARLEMEQLRGDAIPPALQSAVVAAWDFSRDISGLGIADLSVNRLDGTTVNLPARGMTGSDWEPEHVSFRHDPTHYGAIHFHDDDIYDAGWKETVAFTAPQDLRSGLYALRLKAGEREDRIPFIVRPPRDRATAPLAYLASSATWLAYANLNPVPFDLAELLSSRVVILHEANILIDEHPEWGPSLYDVHSDGSGVCYSSLYRPILNLRPGYISSFGGRGSSLREFNADTHVVDWLEAKGFSHDVITDDDLHRDGLALLSRYQAVITGTHPEYFSTAMWDAAKAYTDGGGRLLVMGGNGFYWRIAYHPELPNVIEVRRAGPAIRTWETAPGEDFQSFDGLRGGLWRALGRPPQSIQGTGFVSEGFDLGSYYRRNPASLDPRARFIFDGVGEDELIGDFGLQGGGAAGVEIDRADFALGTPRHALVLATSEGHTESYRLVNEEIPIMIPNVTGTSNERIAADLVFFETAGGGAVFTTGSIAWSGALSHNAYDNNVSRITENVLRRFLDAAPFDVSRIAV